MSLEHSPAREGPRPRVRRIRPGDAETAFTITEWCKRNSVSRRTYYNLQKAGQGPRLMQVLGVNRISVEADADWRREREAAAMKE